MEPMYRGIPFSPQTVLTDTIGAADTIIPVDDVSVFPDAPNYATIGTDTAGETILYAAKAAGALSGCTRGVEGAAKAWGSGTIIARNYTAKDMESLQKNVEDHDTALLTKYSAENTPPYPVKSVNGKTGAVSLSAADVGALPSSTKIPAKTSDLTNDSGFITGYTETDPTVPAWAKASTKPSYSKSEVGLGNVENVKQYSASNPPPYPVKSVNGKTGAVSLSAADVGAVPAASIVQETGDSTSKVMSQAAVTKELNQLSNEIVDLSIFVTPQMFDAVDDAAAIQAAIDAADYVVIPEGNYSINSPVTIPSGKKIQIEGTVTVNSAVGFIVDGGKIEICGNGTVRIPSSVATCSIFKFVLNKGIQFVDIKDISMWGAWNYDNSNNHIGVEFTGDSTAGTCCYININCKLNCFTKAIWSHESEGQNSSTWLTQVDVHSTFQNSLQAVAYEWMGGASRIRGVIQPKCTSNVTPNSVDLPLCILPEGTFMDAMVWDMDQAMNKYAVKVAGQNVTILSEIGKSYMDLPAVVKPSLVLRTPTENLATKEDIEAIEPPSLNTNFRIDENGNLLIEENAPYTNLLDGVSYQDGYRINSAGNVVAQTGTVLTGFIPYHDVSDSDVIRTKGVSYPELTSDGTVYCSIFFYDENFNLLKGLRLIDGKIPTGYSGSVPIVFIDTTGTSMVVDDSGIATIRCNYDESVVVSNPVAYIRLCAKGVGSDLIITRNEEIVDYVADEKSIGKVRPQKGVDYFTEDEQEEFVEKVIGKQTTETWTFTLEDGSTTTKKVVLA